MNYKEEFSKRASSYFSAMSRYPNIMTEEFQTAVDALELEGGETVVNIPAGCVNLEQFMSSNIHYKPFEIDESFARNVKQEVCSLSGIPCDDHTVDRVITVAGLHHTSQEERIAFYKEVKRILKANGTFVIADVQKESKQDEWLNGFVNTYNSFGHKGLFWSEEDKQYLEEAGFVVEIQVKNYFWRSKNHAEMIDFCKELFYLDKANLAQIQKGLEEILGAKSTEIPWSLVYFICKLCP